MDGKPIVGFLGAGQMATALAVAWRRADLLDPASLAADPSAHACTTFQSASGLTIAADNPAVVAQADVVVLAVKPQVLPSLLQEIAGLLRPDHLVISIAAGVTLPQLHAGLGERTRLIRVMPNTPALVGAGASGFSPSRTAEPADVQLVAQLFGAVGTAVQVPEHLLDAVTGLSGSGPAYVYIAIEALADGGVKMGLPREAALALAAQTVLGAARMVLTTQEHPGVLKDRVASPGGTTIAGLHALERTGFRAALMDAVEAATVRARELGK